MSQFNRSYETIRADERGITLIEVLVVIAIVGILVALLLPAIEMAREASRRSSCVNSLRQIAIAAKLHTDTHKTFPTGGWGPDWVGDPDAGFGPRQPGGWIYNILPYIEESALRDIAKGQRAEQKREQFVKVLETPIEIFNCPSRRLPRLYPYKGPAMLENVTPPEKVAKSDYVINRRISSENSEVIPSEIQLHGKGMSRTALAGEKSLASSAYTTGTGAGDTLTMYVGDCDDVARNFSGPLVSDQSAASVGISSPHPAGANIAFCDGSVRFIADDQAIETPN
jgi:prepilin-type N-terminal cleavage/methylation domain-containing protein/prepilin-type processing-associated H-X9-DG protein